MIFSGFKLFHTTTFKLNSYAIISLWFQLCLLCFTDRGPWHFHLFWLWSLSLLVVWCHTWTLQRLHRYSNSWRMEHQNVPVPRFASTVSRFQETGSYCRREVDRAINWFSSGSVMVLGGVSMEWHTDLHSLGNGTLEILGLIVRPYTSPGFLLVHDSVQPLVVREYRQWRMEDEGAHVHLT